MRFKIKKQADPAIPQKKTRKMKYCMAPAKEISGKVAIAAIATNSNAGSSKWTACFSFPHSGLAAVVHIGQHDRTSLFAKTLSMGS